MMAEMGLTVSAEAIADYYGELLDLFVYDERDPAITRDPFMALLQTNTLMNNRTDRLNLTSSILQYALERSS
jgi:hypothetical protein